MSHSFEGMSEEVRRRKIEQMLLQHHTDIMRLLKRADQPVSYGLAPHAEDAFAGVTGGAAGAFFGLRLGKTDAAHNKGASGTISIYSGTAGSETDTGINVTAFNKFADLESGKWCVVATINSQDYLIAGEC